MSQENVEIVRNMLDAFNCDDLEAVIASYEEGCEIVEPPRCQAPGAAEFKPKAFTTTGDLVLCELVSRGLGPASGVPIEWTTFAVVRVRTGKIAQVRVFLSREQALGSRGTAGVGTLVRRRLHAWL